MDTKNRVESALIKALDDATGPSCPPNLATALRYALFPGGGRVRPRIALAVASACGDPAPQLSDGVATAIELIHCASLVHDDLPIFDDAKTRRGRPALHRQFGDEIALLVGDGLIVQAFQLLARASVADREAGALLIEIVSRAAGTARGIVAGQAWESEEEVDVELYHRSKTASLFEAAAMGGAAAAGQSPESWSSFGLFLGEAYQAADDIADALGDAEALGKPVGQDSANQAPSAVSAFGLPGAVRRLDSRIERAVEAIPPCDGRHELVELVHQVALRLCPPEVRRRIMRSRATILVTTEPESSTSLGA